MLAHILNIAAGRPGRSSRQIIWIATPGALTGAMANLRHHSVSGPCLCARQATNRPQIDEHGGRYRRPVVAATGASYRAGDVHAERFVRYLSQFSRLLSLGPCQAQAMAPVCLRQPHRLPGVPAMAGHYPLRFTMSHTNGGPADRRSWTRRHQIGLDNLGPQQPDVMVPRRLGPVRTRWPRLLTLFIGATSWSSCEGYHSASQKRLILCIGLSIVPVQLSWPSYLLLTSVAAVSTVSGAMV